MKLLPSHRFLMVSGLLAAFVSLPQPSFALTATWNGLGTDWNTSANWNG